MGDSGGDGGTDLDVIGALTRMEAADAALRHRLRERLHVSGSDVVLLQFVGRAEAGGRTVRVADLVRHLGVSSPAVTATTQRLERAGYLERSPHPEDRRSRIIRLTADTRAAFTAALDHTNEQLHELLSSFSDDERARFVHIIERVTTALDDGAPPSPGGH
ncbi:MarR family winged helix-turn-helix transcriptional regulator [Curtobacterium sp. MCSS17_008]|uniref:MarR family winged helix-turn-helix transcriptional regulator n=1 Tax=Curtobacterium sp. MCSS17_008 TaxID=2175647 RepID=UPI0015E8A612|nr:MarR family transcriptional regulator [Curtobacterium sp. MCSS17_008]